MSVPIATSPGRSGFGPHLSLSYDSGAGNGPFGFGWSLSLPSITRKTDKGLPRYQDADESDVFILSGAEDLVPVFKTNATTGEFLKDAKGNFVFDESPRDGYLVRRFRPRIEGLFARIERWTNLVDPADVFWRSITKDNVTTFYGRPYENDDGLVDTNHSRIADHADPSRIFSWLICQSHDDKGNAIRYEYVAEDSRSVDASQANERNRTDKSRSANRYLKRIFYGNATSILASGQPMPPLGPDLSQMKWLFEIVFDYGERHYQSLSQPTDDPQLASASVSPSSAWPVRVDPFSSYRAGFEVRTYRLCRRVLMFHHFPQELGVDDCVVRTTEFTYSESPIASFITSVTQSGYVLTDQGPPNKYLKKSLPPVEYGYSPVPDTATLSQQPVKEIDAESLENLPIGFEGGIYQWVDLDGEGTSGILTEQGDGWYYKRNLSPNNQIPENGSERTAVRLGSLELVSTTPATDLTGGQAQFLDLAGDGQLDVVQMEGPVRGFYERTTDQTWESFQSFISWPNLNTRDPNLKFIDLTGDGHADILIAEDDIFVWHPSLAEDGFGSAQRTSQSLDEEKGPRLVFDDGTQSFYLADLSGDGLSDLARIRNGEVCYWPNLGYGRFGAKITMDGAPWFDSPDQFDQRRIRLADTDGSGTTDILYLRCNSVQIYFNQSGNSWSDSVPLPQFPPIDNIASVQALDLLGNGTACLVWSSPLPGVARRPMRYLALMQEKPHLLVSVKNNLGAETKVHYAPSTKFYLNDKQAGTPWITKLPFPVHVVERVETYDWISRNHFVTRYVYHHGYFDGVEREFRGFGMVEQRDTEEFAALSASDVLPDAANVDAASHVPPVYTKTWFHTGAYLDGARITKQFEHEYYSEGDTSLGESDLTDMQLEAMLLPDTTFPTTLRLPDGTSLPWTLSAREEREACRALKGSILRIETYAEDGKEESDRPYSVSERNYTIEQLQPRGENKHAVFFAHPRESIDFHYERKLYDVQGKRLADPRITQSLTLVVDDFGNVLRSAAVAYGRRHPGPSLTLDDQAKQQRTHLTFTENGFTIPILEDDAYRAPLPCESRTYELLKANPVNPPDSPVPDVTNLFRFEKLNEIIDTVSDGNHDLLYKDWDIDESTLPQPRRRLIEHVRTIYRANNLTGPKQGLLGLAQLESRALPGESYKLAFTPELLAQIYKRKLGAAPEENLIPDPASVLRGEGGYILSDDQKTAGLFPASDPDAYWWIPSGRSFHSRNSDNTAAQELPEAQAHFFLPRRFQDPFLNNAFVDYDAHDLLLIGTEDALQNTVTSENDYRVLQRRLITDPNGNRSQVAFDTLGLIAGTAVMAKASDPAEGDLLDASFTADLTQAQVDAFIAQPRQPGPTNSESQATPIVHELLANATTRIIYDLERFSRTRKANPDDPKMWEPPFAATIARETHVSDLPANQDSKLQISFSYSDGFGREIQKKIPAEPGPLDLDDPSSPMVNPRWVGSGWTIFNNKGNPVRRYEPFFSPTHEFEFAKQVGVSPVLFYDPFERVVATLHPNHTWEKVVFDPWQQETWDVSDTATLDPRNDEHVKGFFLNSDGTPRLPTDNYLPTWHALRTDPANAAEANQKWPDPKIRDAEKSAAEKTAKHANTPTTAYFDTLGRTLLTIAHNRFERDNAIVEEKYPTRVELDIEGNQREVIDAKDRIVMRNDYDMLSTRIHQASMEAGDRWMLNDVTDKPIRAWNSRGFTRRISYDELRRPTGLFVTESGSGERLAERTVYGESQGAARNHRTRVFQVCDGAGVVTSDAYDFKGNLLRSRRELLPDYKGEVDWQQNPAPSDGTFTGSTTYDALNRPIELLTPHNTATPASVIRHVFNEANLLDKVEVSLRGAAANDEPVWTPFVTNINYNAKGQRTLIRYANGVETTYEYDDQTFRLIHLKTTRTPGQNGLASQIFKSAATVQDLRYAYDPPGNITRIVDDALKTIFHDNQQVEPVCEYTYDAIYRLIKATGREHIGQSALHLDPPNGDFRDYPFAGLTANANDGQVMRNYSEQYEYDAVGNFAFMRHIANGGSWTRGYEYDANSLLEPTKQSNRLTQTTIGSGLNFSETYTYTDAQGNDVHGCMTAINDMKMVWDFEDQLRQVDLGGGGTAYYVYDVGGQRVRKVIETQNGTRKDERIYLGGFEVYRKYSGNGAAVTLERETLHILDDKQRIVLVETRTVENSNPVDAPVPLQRYQVANHLGSGSLELDQDGGLISYEEYHPYGTTAYQAMNSTAEVSLKRYRYTGKEQDEETGLHYHGARYYPSWLGRWISPDPSGLVGGANLFLYVSANPIRMSDPSGMGEEDEVSTPAAPSLNQCSAGGKCDTPPPEGLLEWSSDYNKEQAESAKASKELWETTIKPQLAAGAPISPPPDDWREELKQQHAVMSEAEQRDFAEQEWAIWRGPNVSKPMPEGWDPLQARIDRYNLNEAHNEGVKQGFDLAIVAGGAKVLAAKLTLRVEGELVSRGFFSGGYEVGKAGGLQWGAPLSAEGSRSVLVATKSAEEYQAIRGATRGRPQVIGEGFIPGESPRLGWSHAQSTHHPLVQDALDAVKYPSKSHGNCAEIHILDQTLHAGGDVTQLGIYERYVLSRGRTMFAPPCSSCGDVLSQLGVMPSVTPVQSVSPWFQQHAVGAVGSF